MPKSQPQRFDDILTLEEEGALLVQLKACFKGRLSTQETERLLRLKVSQLSARVLATFASYCIRGARFQIRYAGQSIDVCGTGGDQKGTFNVSTATSLLLAASGVVVQKNGSGSASGRVGSSDLLKTIGVPCVSKGRSVIKSIEERGGAWLHAPDIYPQLATLAKHRKRFGKPSVFNLLGPLLNPGLPTHRLVGVYSMEAGELMASALQWLGVSRAYVIYGHGGFDEATPCYPCTIWEVSPYFSGKKIISAAQYGLRRCSPKHLKCASPQESVHMLREVFTGVASPVRDVVVFNTALAFQLLASQSAMSLEPRVAVEKASAVIDDGRAARYLLRLQDS
jgi:anthranilate phosphoribosyltransferase